MGEELIQTRPNACIFSKPMQPRWFYFAEDTTMHWMHDFVEIEGLIEKYQIPLNCVFYPRNPSFISDFFRKTRKEFCSNDPHREELLDCYVEELFVKLSRSLQDENKTEISDADQKKLQDLRWQVISQPEKRWTVADMAKMANLSTSRFHAVYKMLFDTSPVKDVIESKIDYAKNLLLMDEQANLLTVAERLGYKNQYHFIRQFKAITGMTPGAFRKQSK